MSKIHWKLGFQFPTVWACNTVCTYWMNYCHVYFISLCHPRVNSLNSVVCRGRLHLPEVDVSGSWEVCFLPFEIRQKISSQQPR